LKLSAASGSATAARTIPWISWPTWSCGCVAESKRHPRSAKVRARSCKLTLPLKYDDLASNAYDKTSVGVMYAAATGRRPALGGHRSAHPSRPDRRRLSPVSITLDSL
jgi:hypothetical protein